MCLYLLLSNNKGEEDNTLHTSRSVTSVPDPQLALTYITLTSDFALYLWLYPIDKHHTLDFCSVSYGE